MQRIYQHQGRFHFALPVERLYMVGWTPAQCMSHMYPRMQGSSGICNMSDLVVFQGPLLCSFSRIETLSSFPIACVVPSSILCVSLPLLSSPFPIVVFLSSSSRFPSFLLLLLFKNVFPVLTILIPVMLSLLSSLSFLCLSSLCFFFASSFCFFSFSSSSLPSCAFFSS